MEIIKSRKKEISKSGLQGKTIFIVGSRHYSELHAEDLIEKGARVIYPNSIEVPKLTEHETGQIVTREILSLEQKPDVVLVFHPRMNVSEGRTLADNPTMRLARAMKDQGIPTLVMDAYRSPGMEPGKLNKEEEQIMRENGATFRDMFTLYDEITPLIRYMANNKAKLTDFGITKS